MRSYFVSKMNYPSRNCFRSLLKTKKWMSSKSSNRSVTTFRRNRKTIKSEIIRKTYRRRSEQESISIVSKKKMIIDTRFRKALIFKLISIIMMKILIIILVSSIYLTSISKKKGSRAIVNKSQKYWIRTRTQRTS